VSLVMGKSSVCLSVCLGEEVDVSPVMGKGFQVDKVPADSFSTLLMFATGSGISPIKALIESGELNVSVCMSICPAIHPPCRAGAAFCVCSSIYLCFLSEDLVTFVPGLCLFRGNLRHEPLDPCQDMKLQ
jgi:hypothetical protein